MEITISYDNPDDSVVRSVCRSHPGLEREHNEDSAHCDDALGLWVVADGMGGHLAGEHASRLVTETIAAEVVAGALLVTAIEKSHEVVVAAACADVDMARMGSTVVAARLQGQQLDVAWAGDSRAYLWDGKSLIRVTRDHSIVQQMIDRGGLSEDEAMGSPLRGLITRAIGPALSRSIAIDSIALPLLGGQKLMLCSDGLTDLVTDRTIQRFFDAHNDDGQIADGLIRASLEAGGSDNVTVLCLSVPERFPRSTLLSRRRQRRALC